MAAKVIMIGLILYTQKLTLIENIILFIFLLRVCKRSVFKAVHCIINYHCLSLHDIYKTLGVNTDLYMNNLDTGLASLSIANGDPFKLTSHAQHALCG